MLGYCHKYNIRGIVSSSSRVARTGEVKRVWRASPKIRVCRNVACLDGGLSEAEIMPAHRGRALSTGLLRYRFPLLLLGTVEN